MAQFMVWNYLKTTFVCYYVMALFLMRLNSVDDNWFAEFISDWVIPSYLHRQVFREDGTSIVWGTMQ